MSPPAQRPPAGQPGLRLLLRLGRASLRSRAWWIVIGYMAFATLWIYGSDHALALLVPDPDQRLRWSVYKGLAFVLVTGGLLLLFIRRAYGAVEAGYALLRRQEAEIRRFNRLYDALSQINQAIVRLPDRAELFARLCRVLVDHGGFRLAWVGWHNPVTESIEPVAVAGEGEDYVRRIRVYADERPEGQGPSGRAFRSGQPFVCNDLLGDPVSLPWRDELSRRGLRASVALPVRVGGRVAGLLNVYAGEPDFFRDRELALLAEATEDVGFALDNIGREAERREAEATALRERGFSDTMIESMPGILYFYDLAGRFLRWNRNFERLSGYSAAEIARMHPLDFFSPAEKPLLEARIAEVFAHGEASVEASFVAKDGTATPCYFTGRRVEFDGRPCLVGVGIDLSARRQAEAELQELQERYAVVVENMREGLVIATPDTSLLHWNPAALRILGFANPDEGRRQQRDFGRLFQLSALDGTPIPPEQWPLARVRRGEEFVDCELLVRRRDQEWTRILSYTGMRVHYAGGKALAFMMLSDVTARKESEQVLRDAKDILAREVAQRTEELRVALERAEAADRLKSAFLATMSHELRTPLNSIIGFTGILLQELAGPLTAEQAKQLGMVRGSARHLLELINDVLDISKIEAGQLEMRPAPFALPELIDRVVASVRPFAEKKGLSLAVSVAPGVGEVVSDRRRVEQVLLNLLNNGLKFTDRGGVTLTVTLLPEFLPSVDTAAPFAAATLGPAVRLAVADTGIGIKAADLATLFQPFRQVDSGLSRQHEGTGLGLAICRRLATLLGGEITAASEWGRGSTFTFTFPLHPPAPAP